MGSLLQDHTAIGKPAVDFLLGLWASGLGGIMGMRRVPYLAQYWYP